MEKTWLVSNSVSSLSPRSRPQQDYRNWIHNLRIGEELEGDENDFTIKQKEFSLPHIPLSCTRFLKTLTLLCVSLLFIFQ